jgi:hypothetical protein
MKTLIAIIKQVLGAMTLIAVAIAAMAIILYALPPL